jgi:hypothetical protein
MGKASALQHADLAEALCRLGALRSGQARRDLLAEALATVQELEKAGRLTAAQKPWPAAIAKTLQD